MRREEQSYESLVTENMILYFVSVLIATLWAIESRRKIAARLARAVGLKCEASE